VLAATDPTSEPSSTREERAALRAELAADPRVRAWIASLAPGPLAECEGREA
jgi:hypothetical protein